MKNHLKSRSSSWLPLCILTYICVLFSNLWLWVDHLRNFFNHISLYSKIWNQADDDCKDHPFYQVVNNCTDWLWFWFFIFKLVSQDLAFWLESFPWSQGTWKRQHKEEAPRCSQTGIDAHRNQALSLPPTQVRGHFWAPASSTCCTQILFLTLLSSVCTPWPTIPFGMFPSAFLPKVPV